MLAVVSARPCLTSEVPANVVLRSQICDNLIGDGVVSLVA